MVGSRLEVALENVCASKEPSTYMGRSKLKPRIAVISSGIFASCQAVTCSSSARYSGLSSSRWDRQFGGVEGWFMKSLRVFPLSL